MQLNEVNSPQAPAAMSLEDKISLMCVVGTPSTAAEPDFRERMSQNRFGGSACSPIMLRMSSRR